MNHIDKRFFSSLSLSLQRPKTGDALCKECFYTAFENEIHCTIQQSNLFKSGDRVAVAASGGKDSTVLAYVLKLLNERHNYGLTLILLSIDEGITGELNAPKSHRITSRLYDNNK